MTLAGASTRPSPSTRRKAVPNRLIAKIRIESPVNEPPRPRCDRGVPVGIGMSGLFCAKIAQ